MVSSMSLALTNGVVGPQPSCRCAYSALGGRCKTHGWGSSVTNCTRVGGSRPRLSIRHTRTWREFGATRKVPAGPLPPPETGPPLRPAASGSAAGLVEVGALLVLRVAVLRVGGRHPESAWRGRALATKRPAGRSASGDAGLHPAQRGRRPARHWPRPGVTSPGACPLCTGSPVGPAPYVPGALGRTTKVKCARAPNKGVSAHTHARGGRGPAPTDSAPLRRAPSELGPMGVGMDGWTTPAPNGPLLQSLAALAVGGKEGEGAVSK
eukprot:scaffold3166_cov399-Prasinococcus_capsulatus_cf.AAC.1